MNKKVINVDEYISNSSGWSRETLITIRTAIKEAAPNANETISYHMPYYSQNGRVAYFGAYTNHCSFHWISEQDKKTFAKELSNQKVVGSTLQIPRGESVPVRLIKKIVKSRVKSNESKGA